jgi:hypothetical protein
MPAIERGRHCQIDARNLPFPLSEIGHDGSPKRAERPSLDDISGHKTPLSHRSVIRSWFAIVSVTGSLTLQVGKTFF